MSGVGPVLTNFVISQVISYVPPFPVYAGYSGFVPNAGVSSSSPATQGVTSLNNTNGNYTPGTPNPIAKQR